MRSKIILLLLLLSSARALSQQAIGIHLGGDDFYGPQTGNYFLVDKQHIKYSADNAKNDTGTRKALMWQPLIKVSYWAKLSQHFDLYFALSMANLQYPTSSKDSVYINRLLRDQGDRVEKFLGEFDARINYNIISRNDHLISPYIYAGLTASYHNIFWGMDVPVGIGANIRLDKGLFLNLETGYKIAVTNQDFNHLQHTIGVVYWFKPSYRPKSKAEELAEVLPPPDMDKDGVTDSLDKCPTIPGTAEFDGCPDTDGDGVPDNIDECPLVAGSKDFNGCPDTDGDGIPDQKDKCPYVAGTADRGGCPIPDTDHDGIPDDQDKCPTVAGPASNDGCPVIKKEIIEIVEKAARSVYFETGKATLKKASYTSLNRIAKVMKDDPTLYVDISGYTDNVGKPAFNLELSDKRANACRDYLASQGISADRMTAKGYGEGNPIASNKTAIGRAQNRRTEFKLRNYK